MANIWCPSNFSGFYVNGKSYYKLTELNTTEICHYDGKIKQIEKKLTPPPFRMVSDETENYRTWYLFMDCVTTRLQMAIGIFFSVLDPEKCKKIGKIGEILFGGPRTQKKFREND